MGNGERSAWGATVRNAVAGVLALASLGCQDRIPEATRDSWGAPERVVARTEVRFAVIGDYGRPGAAARRVARLVASWRPDVVITTGDNNYPRGAAATIDANVGQHYHRFLAPYHGTFGAGARRNRFFPALGNHDLYTGGGRPYFDYFTLPGNERYYDFIAGPVRFFALNSDQREPHGTWYWSTQRRWLRERLARSRARWHVVYFHHAPYSSGDRHDPARWMRWPFAAWGADVVLTGHEHSYERLAVDGIPYFVVGLGGASISDFADPPLPESRRRFNDDHGALLGVAGPHELRLEFATWTGAVVDRAVLRLPPDAQRAITVRSESQCCG